jgi:hypothetical protein
MGTQSHKCLINLLPTNNRSLRTIPLAPGVHPSRNLRPYTMAINTSMSESSEENVTDTAQVFEIPPENQSEGEAEPTLELRTFLAYPASPVAAAS